MTGFEVLHRLESTPSLLWSSVHSVPMLGVYSAGVEQLNLCSGQLQGSPVHLIRIVSYQKTKITKKVQMAQVQRIPQGIQANIHIHAMSAMFVGSTCSFILVLWVLQPFLVTTSNHILLFVGWPQMAAWPRCLYPWDVLMSHRL